MPATGKKFLERAQERENVLARGTVAHEADAPYLSSQCADPGAYFDTELIEKRAPHHRVATPQIRTG
jgi:hypothetical protein